MVVSVAGRRAYHAARPRPLKLGRRPTRPNLPIGHIIWPIGRSRRTGLGPTFQAVVVMVRGARTGAQPAGADGEGVGAGATNIMHAFLLKAAAVGVGMYFASGDSSGVDAPADDPYAIAVGGTTLGVGKSANRLAAPLVADGQQGQARPFGFLNPTLYKLAGSSAFHDALPLTGASPPSWRAVVCATTQTCGFPYMGQFDYQGTDLDGYTGQVTARGYDNMTGVGSPNGQPFITAIRAMG